MLSDNDKQSEQNFGDKNSEKMQVIPWLKWVNPPSGSLPEGIEHKTFYSPTAQAEVGYSIYLPPGYNTGTERYPVIYWLHGINGMESKSPWNFVNLNKFVSEKKVMPVIVVFVNGLSRSLYADSFDMSVPAETIIMKDLIPFIDKTYRTIGTKEGRAIEGFSMGGLGALKYAAKYPETFSAVMTYGAAMLDAESIESRHPDLFKIMFNNDKVLAEENVAFTWVKRNASEIKSKLKIKMVVGSLDGTRAWNEKMHELLIKLEIPHEFDILDDIDHQADKYFNAVGERVFSTHIDAFKNSTQKGTFLEDKNIKVEFNVLTASITVIDKKTGTMWEQKPSKDKFEVTSVKNEKNKLTVSLKGKVDLNMELELSGDSDLILTLDTENNNTQMTDLYYPGPLITPDEEHYLVIPDSEGILVQARDASFPLPKRVLNFYEMNGLIMPWAGIVDKYLEKGYMVIVDTPADSGINITDREENISMEVVWKPEMKKFGYSRSMRYHFFSEGGYVAQAKYFRNYIESNREIRTLKQKAETNQSLNKLIGAVHIYIWDDGRNLSFINELNNAGITKAWIAWDPSHPPYPAKGFDEGLKSLGYVAGVYDLYRDIYDSSEYENLMNTNSQFQGMDLHRYYYPSLFPDIVGKREDGSLQSLRLAKDTNLMRYSVSTKAMLPYIGDRINRELQTYPHESVFLDVVLASGLKESYDPINPMTRREDLQARTDILKYFSDDLDMVVGSEWGSDFGVNFTSFMHGLMSLNEYFGSDRTPGTHEYRGDWSDLSRPAIVLGEHKPAEKYSKFGMNEFYRIPLYELVYHDAVVTSWRWDDSSHKQPSLWDKKDLFSILYGTAPLWNLDQEMWNKHKDHFINSYNTIGPWLEKIGYDQMINHKFLNETRTVQESIFSSGWKVIVNFGNEPYKYGGLIVKPNSFEIVKEDL